MDWFRSLPRYRQRIYLLLIGAILVTLPCWCLGILLLVLAPAEPTPPPSPTLSGFVPEAPTFGPSPLAGISQPTPSGASILPAIDHPLAPCLTLRPVVATAGPGSW